MSRYEKKAIERGSGSAQLWWQGVKSDIEKRRGPDALNDLVNRMKKERENGKSRVK
jgi:hypothetical protein